MRNNIKDYYVVAIMDKHYINDEYFIFTFNHIAIGEYDEVTDTFVDRNGNEFYSVNDMESIADCKTSVFARPIKISEIKEILQLDEGLSSNQLITSYQDYLSNVIYISKYQPEHGESTSVYFNLDNPNAFLDGFNMNDNDGPISLEDAIAEMVDDEVSIDDIIETISNKYKLQNCDLSDELLQSEIKKITTDITEGKYSLEELFVLRNELAKKIADMESVKDSLELQVEASLNGESSTKLKNEPKGGYSKEDRKKYIKWWEEELEKQDDEKQISSSKVPKGYIDLKRLYNSITRTLIGQDEAVRKVIAEIARKEQNPTLRNRAILLTGPTGVGKTKMMQLISKYLNKPFYKIDATKLTMPGYVGTDLEEELWKLYEECGFDKEKCENAIVFFDEIDKKGSGKKDDVSGKGVLNTLLPFIEGSKYSAVVDTKKYNSSVEIDTSNMIVILGGAFTDVYKNLRPEKSIGFGSKISTEVPDATVDDFIDNSGMPDEFMGRTSIVKLNELDAEALKRILTDSDESAIKIQEKLFDELGVKINFTDDYITEVAEQAYKKKTGARGLNGVVDDTTREAYYDAYSSIFDDPYEEITLTKETVDDPKVYQYTKKK